MLNPSLAKLIGPPVTALMADCKSTHATGAGGGGGAGGGIGAGTGALTASLPTTFRFDQVWVASCSTVLFWSCEPAVPANVMVSPLTVRLKSRIEALSLKTAPAFEKSSEATVGLRLIWSLMLTSGPSEP